MSKWTRICSILYIYFIFYTWKPLRMFGTSLEPCCQAGDSYYYDVTVFQTVEVSTRTGGLQKWLITWSRNVSVGSQPCTYRVSYFHCILLCCNNWSGDMRIQETTLRFHVVAFSDLQSGVKQRSITQYILHKIHFIVPQFEKSLFSCTFTGCRKKIC